MKKKRLLFLLPLIASFALTSCDLSSLLPNGPMRRSSKEEEENSEVDNSINNRSSSNYSSSKSSYHKHAWGEWYVVVQPTCTEYGIDERMCAECGAIQQAQRAPRGHTWGEWTDYISATCTEDGLRMHRCSVCGYEEMEQYPAYGHEYDENQIVWSQEPSCERDGVGQATCLRCGSLETIKIPAYGHEMYLIGGEAQPTGDKAPVRVYSCSRCGITYLGFKCTDVTSESKNHLVYEDNEYGEAGARFWGRPIGNDIPLNEYGDADSNNHPTIFNQQQTGDFFEFVFDLSSEQAAILSTCALYCDAKPAAYLGSQDFWARRKGDEEWTQGVYIDDNPSTPENEIGQEILDYRYCLYVDDVLQSFDPSVEVIVKGSGSNTVRNEFQMPYTFHLHQGTNKIRLHMAGGYRSTFYNFIFRPYVEPTPVEVNETSLEVEEGKTARITSSMTGLTYKSSSTSICTVDANGLVTGVKVGTATITISKEGNYKDAKVPVTVVEKEGIVTLNLTDGVIAPEGGFEAYYSAYSGDWLRNPKKDATITYTFNSELAGLFDIQLGLRGSNIVLADNFNIKVNGVDVALEGTANTSYSAVEYVVGQADLKVGENTMVITALVDNSLYLKTIKFIPHQYIAFQTWGIEDLENNRTDSGWADSKQFGDSKAFKFNKTGSVAISYSSESAQKVMLQLKIAVKYSNRNATAFWKQNGTEKTRITINGTVLEAGDEPDFSGVIDSGVSDTGNISTVVWYNIIEIDLVAGTNTIKIEYLGGGYSYYLGGIALAK